MRHSPTAGRAVKHELEELAAGQVCVCEQNSCAIRLNESETNATLERVVISAWERERHGFGKKLLMLMCPSQAPMGMGGCK